jgi:curved DNA-binding protein CbpA
MSNPFKQCPFHVLNLPQTATQADVKKQWKKLILQAHPDKDHSDQATERTKILNDAKERAVKVCLRREEGSTNTGRTSSDEILRRFRKDFEERMRRAHEEDAEKTRKEDQERKRREEEL